MSDMYTFAHIALARYGTVAHTQREWAENIVSNEKEKSRQLSLLLFRRQKKVSRTRVRKNNNSKLVRGVWRALPPLQRIYKYKSERKRNKTEKYLAIFQRASRNKNLSTKNVNI